jgi:hypothetical protein
MLWWPLPEERALVDYTFQLLAIKGAEANAFYLSASSVRSILQERGLVTTEPAGCAAAPGETSRTGWRN